MKKDKYGDMDVEDSDDFDGLLPDDGSGMPLNFNDRNRDEELYDEEEDDIEEEEDEDWDDFFEEEEEEDDEEEDEDDSGFYDRDYL